MPRDRLPSIEFETIDDLPSSSTSGPAPADQPAWHRLPRPPGWVFAAAVVVIALVAATTMRRLSDERDLARAEAARTQAQLVEVRSALFAEVDNAVKRDAPGRNGGLPVLEGVLGGMFTLPSSPSLVEGTIGVLVTTNGLHEFAWIVVDGRGAVPGGDYFVEGGLCSNGTVVPGLDRFALSAVSEPDGDLRVVVGPVVPEGPPVLPFDIDDSDVWAQFGNVATGEVLGGVRGPLRDPTWVPPGADPCNLPGDQPG